MEWEEVKPEEIESKEVWEEVKPNEIKQLKPSKLVQIIGKAFAPIDYIYGRPARAFESYLWKTAAEGPYQGVKAAMKALEGYPPYTYEQYYEKITGEKPPQWLKALAETGTTALESLFPSALTQRVSILGLQKRFGELWPSLMEAERLNLLKPRVPTFDRLDIDKLFNKHYGQLVETERQAQKAQKAIQAIKKSLKLSPEREKLVAWAVEQPEKYLSRLTPQEKHLVENLRNHFDKMYKIAEKEGVINDFIENYLTHIYQIEPRQVRAFLRTSLHTIPKFGKPRKIPTLEMAEEIGFRPVYELDKVVGIYDRALGRAIANKRLMNTLSSMTDEYGGPLIHHPEVAKRIGELMNPYTPQNRYSKAYWWLVDRIKRFIMYNPLIHGWNIYSDVLDEVNFRALKALRMVTKGPKAKELERLGFKNIDELEKEMAEYGVDLANVWNVSSELRRGLGNIEAEMKGIRGIARKIESWSDKVLWGKIVAEAQKSIYVLKKAQLMKKGLSAEEAAEATAHYVNDLLGTLPTHVFGKESAKFLRALFFARDWTASNLRLITGALGVRPGTKIRMPLTGEEIKVGELLPQWMTHKGLSPEQMRALQTSYFRHLTKGIAGLLLSTNLINYALTGHWAFENEPGHWLDIDLGIKDKQRREVYIVNPLFRYIRDYFGWGSEPHKTMWNKMEPLLKQGIEQIINHSVWQNKPIYEPGLSFGLKAQRGLEYFLKGITPLGSLAPRRGEERTWLESLIPLTGTWVRHGLRGGKFAHDLMKYKQKIKAEKRLADEEINELLQQGDFESALKTMLQTERYSSLRGIVNRLLRYKQPLYQRFMTLPNKDRLKFIMTLRPKDRKKFLQLIMEEKEAPLGWEEVKPEEIVK